MRLRRLSSEGIRLFAEKVERCADGQLDGLLGEISTAEHHSEAVAGAPELENREFASAFDMAGYLAERLGSMPRTIERDVGAWAFITWYWFDAVRGAAGAKGRKVGELSRWVPAVDSSRRYYRHLLLGPYLVYKAHEDDPKRALGLLCQPVHIHTEVVAQIASRSDLISCRAVAAVTTQLYYDPAKRSLKRGASTKDPGGPRRLADILTQLDRTYDLHEITGDELLRLLPGEFDRFRR